MITVGPVEIARVTATGAAVSIARAMTLDLVWVTLIAGASNATAIVRETDGSGRILATVAALANDSRQVFVNTPAKPAAGGVGPVALHVTLTGSPTACEIGYR